MLLKLNRQKLLNDRELLGRWAEKRSEKFLKRKGFKTLTRNFTCKTGEIDRVMVDADGAVVFVEVRSKAEGGLILPEESITKPKRDRLTRAARYFLAIHKIEDRPIRFDVVTVVLGPTGREQINHYPNAFVPWPVV